MRILQINAVYEKFSTGRNTKELHEAMKKKGIESFVACTDTASLSSENAYKIGNKLIGNCMPYFQELQENRGTFHILLHKVY